MSRRCCWRAAATPLRPWWWRIGGAVDQALYRRYELVYDHRLVVIGGIYQAPRARRRQRDDGAEGHLVSALLLDPDAAHVAGRVSQGGAPAARQARGLGQPRPGSHRIGPAISRLLATLQDYGIVILASAAVLIIWALHNQLRFRGQHRRRAGKTVDVADLGELYGRPAADVAHWQQSRILILQHAPDGTLISALAKIPVKQGDAA